jgi:hypothetical protein
MILQNLDFWLEGASDHCIDHSLNFLGQLCLAFWRFTLSQSQGDLTSGISHQRADDRLVNVCEFGLHLADQVRGDGD